MNKDKETEELRSTGNTSENRGLAPTITTITLVGSLLAILLTASRGAEAQESLPSVNSVESAQSSGPTEAQLKLGQEILDKLAYVIENLPLQDASRVMRAFGFSDLYTVIYPTYVRIGPNKTTSLNQVSQLKGTGFANINIDPSVRSEKIDSSAKFYARLNHDEACITPDAVRAKFGNAETIRLSRTFHTCCAPIRPKVSNIDVISFEPLSTPNGMIGLISFRFEYQLCASDVNFNYREQKENK